MADDENDRLPLSGHLSALERMEGRARWGRLSACDASQAAFCAGREIFERAKKL